MKKSNKLLLSLAIILVVIVASGCFWFIWWPEQERISFETKYLNIMKRANSPEIKANLTNWFERDYNFTELYDWVHERLEFVPINESFERNTDPVKILESGKGRCEEFSILYVAACLARGYQSRIVIAVYVDNSRRLYAPHAWAEVKLDGWVHVDPSDRVWNKPFRYKTWVWGKDIGSNLRIYAFEDGKIEDATPNY